MRVAVTGVGMVTPLGLTSAATWQGLLSGRRAVQALRRSQNRDRSVPFLSGSGFGAAVEDVSACPSRAIRFVRRAAEEAIAQATLSEADLRSSACVIGTSKIDMQGLDDSLADPQADLVAACLPSHPAAVLAGELGCEAAVLSPIAACATGLVSIIRAADLIRDGHCRIALAGGTDSSLHPALLASYRRLGVLARPGDDPSVSCRPFDRRRNGFAVGEGSTVLVLEEWESARRRGARPLAEWIAGRVLSDPSGLTQVDTSGEILAEVTCRALEAAGLSPESVGGVSLHGTATRLNDITEAAALRRVWRQSSPEVPAFGIKGSMGHLMGAAGAVETAACVLALQHQRMPPTVNFSQPDPECRLNVSGSEVRTLRGAAMLKLSLGFGGHMAAGLLAPGMTTR